VQAGMTYDQTAVQVTASNLGASNMNWGGSGNVVSVTVTSLTAKRVAGSFTATLAGIPSSLPPLSITGGVFDVRIDPAQ
jgi:hypothetical protein